MVRMTFGGYTVAITEGKLPNHYSHDCHTALLVEEFDLDQPKQTPQSQSPCVVAVSSSGKNGGWPFLMVAQNYDPDSAGFYPGVIIVPETGLMMIGAGQRLLAYTLMPPKRLWEDAADFGFWGWGRHSDTIIMAAELEMAAWDVTGNKLWSRYVEPPWSYSVADGTVILDIMGDETRFSLTTGPAT